MKPSQWLTAAVFFAAIYAGVQTSALADGRGFPRGGGGPARNPFGDSATYATVNAGAADAGSIVIGGAGKWRFALSGNDLTLTYPGNTASSWSATSGATVSPYAFNVTGTGSNQFICNAASGNNCMQVATEGARTTFGPDTYCTESGTAISCSASSGLLASRYLLNANGGANGIYAGNTLGYLADAVGIAGRVANSANSISVIAVNFPALTVSGTAIEAWYADYAGAPTVATAAVGVQAGLTTAGTTPNTNGTTLVELPDREARITFTEAHLTDADNSQDLTIATLPAGSEIRRIVMDVTVAFTGGGTTDADVICGPTAGTNTYLLTEDIDTAIGTYGDAEAEIGTALVGGIGNIGAWSTTHTIVCRFTNTGGTLAALTAGSVTFYVIYRVLK